MKIPMIALAANAGLLAGLLALPAPAGAHQSYYYSGPGVTVHLGTHHHPRRYHHYRYRPYHYSWYSAPGYWEYRYHPRHPRKERRRCMIEPWLCR